MTELWNDKPPIGAEEVARAEQILQKYKVGKAALDQRLVDNELWFRMGHWKNYQNPMMEGKPQPSSGWLFNSIANKHADAMDNYPAPNVLPRAPDDEQTARVLSSVLHVVLEQGTMSRCTATPGGASSSRAPASRGCSGTRNSGAVWARSRCGP